MKIGLQASPDERLNVTCATRIQSIGVTLGTEGIARFVEIPQQLVAFVQSPADLQ